MNSLLSRLVLTSFLIVSLAPAARSDDGAISPRMLDSRIDQAAFNAIVAGGNLYAQKDVSGCHRLYHGALVAIEPMLAHRPDLQQAILQGIRDAEGLKNQAQKALALRRVLDAVLSGVRSPNANVPPAPGSASAPLSAPSTSGLSTPARKPLWDRMGGEPVVKAVVHDFIAQTLRNPDVDFSRRGKYKLDAAGITRLESGFVEMISSLSGGPLSYEGRDMSTAHGGMAITNAQFSAATGDLATCLKRNGVLPDDVHELIGMIGGTRKDIVEKK